MAVHPSSMMGATKKVAERVVQQLAHRGQTQFITARFGNVLRSRGCVIPLFERQIEVGGPVTVTHPEMVRYFMSIPEAVRLVLNSGAIGRSGDLCILDRGVGGLDGRGWSSVRGRHGVFQANGQVGDAARDERYSRCLRS